MFRNKTLLVLGAGASKEANLPTGFELKQKIASILNIRFENGIRQDSGDHVVCEAMRHAVRRGDPKSRDINPHLHAAWRIRDAMPQALSIDNFIDAHQGNTFLELAGKLAIVRAILEAEKGSLLYTDTHHINSHPNFKALENTWFNAFMQLLTENCRAEQLQDKLSRIGLVIFNYDRCIEHFLYHSLQTYYGLDPEQAASLISDIEIFHPYGTVGKLPWQQQKNTIGFGADPNPAELVDLAGQIRTFSEGTDPESSDVVAIRKAVAEANIVMFLGFAYHPMNLELIRPQDNSHSNAHSVHYFGTAKGISNNDCGIISKELAHLGGADQNNIIVRNDLTCIQLFKEYWRSLSLSTPLG